MGTRGEAEAGSRGAAGRLRGGRRTSHRRGPRTRSARGTLPPQDDRGGRMGGRLPGRELHVRRIRTRAGEGRSAWRCSHAGRGVGRDRTRPGRGHRSRKSTASGAAAAAALAATQPQREPPWCCLFFPVAPLPHSFCWFSGSGRGRSGCHGYFGGWGSNGSYFDGLGGSPGSGRGRDGSGMIAARRGITSSKSAKRRDK